jgi:addiction module HigA family antidote
MTEFNNELKMKLAPVHPGEILLEEFMKPLGLSQTRLGRDLGVSPRRINEIIHGKRSVTADTALRLSRYFGISAEFWLGLQADYDLDTASDRLAERIAWEVKIFGGAPEVREKSGA